MSDATHEQTIALAGVCKASYFAQALARNGTMEREELSHILSWIMTTDPKNTLDVYGSERELKKGFEVIQQQLGHKAQPKDAELTRYTLNILVLERKLLANKQALQKLTQGISGVERQLAHFELADSQVVANFADLYKDVVSPLGSRIQIMGNPNHLKNSDVQNKIRAVLLAGVRSAVLWRQLGGKRRNIVFRRQKWLANASQALNKFSHF